MFYNRKCEKPLNDKKMTIQRAQHRRCSTRCRKTKKLAAYGVVLCLYAWHVLIKFLNALQMELTVPFLMGCLERSIVNGKRECVVFDAAVVASGYVSGLPVRETVSLICC